jgi:phosphoglycerol transferase MdoB-like AlkP superfamily enzyme
MAESGDITSPDSDAASGGDSDSISLSETTSPGNNSLATTGTDTTAETEGSPVSVTEPAPSADAEPENPFNTMNIDFDSLIAQEKDPTILSMHKYFAAVEPTKKNSYTGLFKGCNLIMLTAEGFSPYAVDPELTPTLYKMVKEGFEFKNFYNPVWGVSTSDGEYVACTGLIPKEGIWSFARSGENYMPFVMGNQFNKLGYLTKAWHDHTYTYYKRNISHPNMGYDYKGVGNGLEIKKTWPESDLEMIEATAPEYIGQPPFHTYYMTVSGHLQYNFGGNYIAKKNRKYVEGLPYSSSSKAYIACNMELEFAMKALLEKLEAAGTAENTVIAISPDHYPYGLSRECIDELAGHKVEENFELYKSTLIIWKKGMEPVAVDKPCCSLDIIPTLSNLFGLEFDSRLLMGRDILSDTPPLVIFSNWSWITDRARLNSVTNRTEFTDGTEKDADYVKRINRIMGERFKYSAKILETDYYGRIFNK